MTGEKPTHTVQRYEEELQRLRATLEQMGELAQRQVADATAALTRRDADFAGAVVRHDAELDRLEHDIDAFCIRLLALRQPVGSDLRLIVAAIKISHALERIGDYAANAAKRAIVLASMPQIGSLNGFGRMAELVSEAIDGAVGALVQGDASQAEQVWRADVAVDQIYSGIFRELLTHMMEDAHAITAAIHLLFVARNLERIGDHATNIAEMAYYAVRGEALPEERPKADDTSAYAATGSAAMPERSIGSADSNERVTLPLPPA